MLYSLLFVACGLVLLVVGADALVSGASRIAQRFGRPPLIIGLTIVAIGTSMPELTVSTTAALGGSSDLALGNVVGSNISNIALCLGLAGLVAPAGLEAPIQLITFDMRVNAAMKIIPTCQEQNKLIWGIR